MRIAWALGVVAVAAGCAIPVAEAHDMAGRLREFGAARSGSGVLLPVVRCSTPPSVSGFLPQFRRSGFPHGPRAAVSVSLGRRLAFYSNGWLTLLAPRGWKCSGAVGATGHLYVSVLPPNARSQVVYVSKRTPAVTAEIPSPDTGEVGGLACPFFPGAAPQPGWAHCPGIPTSERVVRLGPDAVAFSDPPYFRGTGNPSGGPYPANGVVVYRKAHAALATCTLPSVEHAECTAILNDFLARYPL